MLSPYITPVEIDGTGRKLLAIYMVGSDLEENPRHPAGTNDFEELIAGYNNLTDKGEVEVIVAFGGADKDGWHGMKFVNMSQILADSQDGAFGNETHPDAYLYQADYANMGDESSLKLFLDYLRDGYANFDQRFLTLWDHGGSYMGFGNDTNFNKDGLLLDEMTRAFERSQIGVFDLIGFDACLMASVEVAKIIKPHAEYMIASEETEPGHGWLWSAVIQIYADEDDIVETGKRMVDNFVQDVHKPRDDGKTLSLLDLSQYDGLEAALNPVVSAYGQRMLSNREYANNLISASRQTRSYNEGKKDDSRLSIDLKHFAQLLLANLPPDSEAAPPLNDLIAAIDRFVVHSKHDGSRPNSYGVAIDAPENAGEEYEEYAAYKVNDTWLDFQNTFQAFRQSDKEAPKLTASDGLTVVFEDENLAGVNALHGFTETVESEDYFMVVAELDAFPTGNAGEYFADAWDQRWFTVKYDSREITAWIPAAFSERFVGADGREYTTYASEIDYWRGDSSTADYAVMTLVVNEDMEVVNHQIQTYQYIYTSPEDETGSIQFDKATFRIAAGDAVQFWNWGFHLEDPSLDRWFETGGVVEFVQDPVFQLEFLEFEDQSGQPIAYQQGMWAEDASGNGEFYLISPPDESIFAAYEDPSGSFRAYAPAAWLEAQPDASIGEVFLAYAPNGSGQVSISVYRDDASSLSDFADLVESELRAQGAEGVLRTIHETEQGALAVMFEYWLGDAAYVHMSHPLNNGESVDVIYSFIHDRADAFETEEFFWLAYNAFAAFWIY